MGEEVERVGDEPEADQDFAERLREMAGEHRDAVHDLESAADELEGLTGDEDLSDLDDIAENEPE